MAGGSRTRPAGAAVGDGDGAGVILPDILLYAARVLYAPKRTILPQR